MMKNFLQIFMMATGLLGTIIFVDDILTCLFSITIFLIAIDSRYKKL